MPAQFVIVTTRRESSNGCNATKMHAPSGMARLLRTRHDELVKEGGGQTDKPFEKASDKLRERRETPLHRT